MSKSSKRLRRTSAEIDGGLGTAPVANDSGAAIRAGSRRSFLTRAAAGGAIAFGATSIPLATLAPAAFAQSPGTTSGPGAGTTPGTTASGAGGEVTTGATAGKKPKLEGTNLEWIVFAISLELAAAELYDAMMKSGRLSSPIRYQAEQYKLHHEAHNAALTDWAGSESPLTGNAALVRELTPQIEAAKDEIAVAQVAYDLEVGLAATDQLILGELDDWEIAALMATIGPVESEHSLVWSRVAAPDINAWAADIKKWIPDFQTDNDAYQPGKFPVS